MPVRFDDIGNRLKAFRLGSGLSADEIANRLGHFPDPRSTASRRASSPRSRRWRKLAELLGVSVPTLLGGRRRIHRLGRSPISRRTRQIEETSEHIHRAGPGPISYLPCLRRLRPARLAEMLRGETSPRRSRAARRAALPRSTR